MEPPAKQGLDRMVSNYTEKHIRSLDWKQHIRQRPGGTIESGYEAEFRVKLGESW